MKHTLSHLPSLSHTHTHTHTHHTHIKLNRAELEWYRLKKCVIRVDLKVVIVAAFLMCGGSEFQTEEAKWEKAWSSFILYLYSRRFRRQVSALEQRGPMRGSGGLCWPSLALTDPHCRAHILHSELHAPWLGEDSCVAVLGLVDPDCREHMLRNYTIHTSGISFTCVWHLK